MKIFRSTICFAVFAATVMVLVSCATKVVELTPEMTEREIIQQAQTAYDEGHIQQAEEYYQVLLQRYGTNTAIYVEGRYEIGHLYFKQHKFAESYKIYKEIIQIYENSIPGQLPGAYRKLTENDIKKIPDSYKKQIDEQKDDNSTQSDDLVETDSSIKE